MKTFLGILAVILVVGVGIFVWFREKNTETNISPKKIYTYYNTGFIPETFSRDEVLAIGQKIQRYSVCEYITINNIRITATGPNAGGCSIDYFYIVNPVPVVPQNDPFHTYENIAQEIRDRNATSEQNFNNLKNILSQSSCDKSTLAMFMSQEDSMDEPFAILSCLGNIQVFEKQSMPM